MAQKESYSLVLKPIGLVQASSSDTPGGLDEWLNNDDSSILHELNSPVISEDKTAMPVMANIVNKLTDTPEQRVIQVESIIVNESENGFNIMEGGKETALQNGDVITLGDIGFKVEILCETVIEYAGPQRRYDFDSLSTSHADSWSNNTPPDPFSNSSPNGPVSHESRPVLSSEQGYTTQKSGHDPLAFLYNGDSHQQSMPLPQEYNLHAYDQAPELLTSNSTISLNTGLSVDTTGRHSLNNSRYESTPQNHYESTNTDQSNQGNILRDIGINSEQNSSMLSGRFGTSAKTLDQKSPMDMLDEYLDEPAVVNAPASYPQTYQTPPGNFQSYPAPKPFYNETSSKSITGSIKGILKKLIS